MAMLRSSVGLALRHSAPASRFCGKVGRRNPASSITTTRNYDTSKMCDFSKEDFAGCTGVEYMIGAFACGTALCLGTIRLLPTKRDRGTVGQAVKQNPVLILVSMDNMDERKLNREQHV